jgi:hypothetical protein
MAVTDDKNILTTLRIPRQLSDEVRSLASREGEAQATVLRRLLRVGLEHERRHNADTGARR